MADKKIPQLDAASQINSDALFAVSQQVSGAQKTLKGTVGQVGEYIGGTQTFSGLNTTSKNLVGAINEVAQGGGSGGHTILDNEGDALTQRSNLQFKGAYSDDNSTDDTTEVNVVRSMTKAEFDLLSADEKVGFINITDITGGNDDRFQPVIYSEDEREIGVWIDGKPLYQKTYEFSTAITVYANTYTTLVSNSGLNIDTIVYGETSPSNNATFTPISLTVTQNDEIQGYYPTDWSIKYLTLRYTKTTDTAGSGQWTPQGVPAHHYSTDEQIVGTWIDGSTLYEKTVDIGSLPNTSEKSSAHNISNIDKVISVVGYAINSSKANLPLPYSNPTSQYTISVNVNTTYIVVQTGSDRSSYSGYVTIRYTKSTS